MPHQPSESWKKELLQKAKSVELESRAGKIPASEAAKKYLKDREEVLASWDKFIRTHKELKRQDLEKFFGIKKDEQALRSRESLLNFIGSDRLEQEVLFLIYRKLDRRDPAYYERVLDLDPVKDETLWDYITAIESEIIRQKRRLILKSADALGPKRLAALMMLLEEIQKLEQEEFKKTITRATERLSDPNDPQLHATLYDEFSRLIFPQILKSHANKLKQKFEENQKKIVDDNAAYDIIKSLLTPEEQEIEIAEPPKKHEEQENLVLDPKVLAPYRDKIEIQEKALRVLDNFLTSYSKIESKPQRFDFVQTFKDLAILAPPQSDPVAKALSEDILERILVYMSNSLLYPPAVLRELKIALSKNRAGALEHILEYIKNLHGKIVENKKKVLWLLVKHVGIKKSAAIFKEQDLIKERAYDEYLAEHLEPKLKEQLENDEPEAAENAIAEFDNWYYLNKERFFRKYEKIHEEISDLSEELDNDTAYKIIERHLSTSPGEIFELFES